MTDTKSDDQTTDEQTEPTDTVERFDTGASVEATLKRGTGTRDEDKIKLKGKGRTAQEAIDEFEDLLAKYEADWGDRMRAMDPGGDGDD